MVGIEDNTYDGAFAFEATCHSPQPVDVYSEVYRVLKPGAYFLDSAWSMTDSYIPNNPEQEHIKYDIEVRIGLRESRVDTRLSAQLIPSITRTVTLFQQCP